MRLWHKDLLPCLPMQQMISQWRECCAIAARLNSDEHTPNHILVNKILDYDPAHFWTYTNMVIGQFNIRGYSMADKSLQDWEKNYRGWVTYLKTELPWRVEDNVIVRKEDVFNGWHNKAYLRQCYYNLEEKYDCGGIPQDEWEAVMREYLYLKNL